MAELDNVSLRGNTIEQIITGDLNAHRRDDLIFNLENGGKLVVDIQTKLLDRASALKAYNIDKVLRLLAETGNVFCFFFVGLDVPHRTVSTRLISLFDPVILNETRITHHWAGRGSRGVTQITGDIARIFEQEYLPTVDVAGGQSLLTQLIVR